MTSEPFLQPGRNCLKVAHADRATLLVDGEDYFRAIRASMMKARRRIVMLSWDLDTRVEMHDTRAPVTGPLAMGDFIEWLVKMNPDLHIYILRWDIGSIKTLARGMTVLTLIRWLFHPRIHLKLDTHHPPLASVHRKVITIDEDTAFCGGIDVTERRWDTRDHEALNPLRAIPGRPDDGPWHDASMIVQGEIARELSHYAEGRWTGAGGKPMHPADPDARCWPDALDAQLCDVDVAIARTEPLMEDQAEVREIEQLFLDMIATAQRWIYAESQYFASDTIADAIEARLSDPDCPEIVLINPITADGAIEGAIMQPQRAVLLERLAKHPNAQRFRVYHPITSDGEEIYCHAKIMVMDEDALRIGSANLNNRSMGFDSECDLALHAGENADIQRRITAIRDDLIAEHVAHPVSTVSEKIAQTGSLIATIDALAQEARSRGKRSLRPYEMPDHGPIQKAIGESSLMDPDRNEVAS